jgi:quercetin dioxygenase-like cupin family protein
MRATSARRRRGAKTEETIMMDARTKAAVGVLAAAEGEVLDVFGASLVAKTRPEVVGFLLADHVVPPGYVVPPHSHAVDHEALFLLEGELTLLSAHGEARLTAGGTAQLPAGVPHGFRNDTDRPVRLLVLAAPGIQALEMFRHFDRAGQAAPGGLAPPQIIEICRQYGVTMG